MLELTADMLKHNVRLAFMSIFVARTSTILDEKVTDWTFAYRFYLC